MSQGVYVVVEDKHGRRLDNTTVSGAGCHCHTSNGTCWFYTPWGSFDVSARHYGYVSRSQRVHVRKDYWTDVFFTVSSGYELHPSIEGIVHDQNNNLLAGMMVWGYGILGTTKYWGCITKSNGQYQLPINSAGDYRIVCGKTNYDVVEISTYSQISSIPTSTTIKNFTGEYKAKRITIDNPRLCIYGRSMVIRDDLADAYNYKADIPDNNVYTKIRKWNNTLIDTYDIDAEWELVRDGIGGSQYD